jgi:hypothetical protein
MQSVLRNSDVAYSEVDRTPRQAKRQEKNDQTRQEKSRRQDKKVEKRRPKDNTTQ